MSSLAYIYAKMLSFSESWRTVKVVTVEILLLLLLSLFFYFFIFYQSHINQVKRSIHLHGANSYSSHCISHKLTGTMTFPHIVLYLCSCTLAQLGKGRTLITLQWKSKRLLLLFQ